MCFSGILDKKFIITTIFGIVKHRIRRLNKYFSNEYFRFRITICFVILLMLALRSILVSATKTGYCYIFIGTSVVGLKT